MLEVKESSRGCALLFPGESGVTTLCGRVSLTGLSRTGALLSFNALSKADGRSWAPGTVVFLLGLPCGVATGSRKSCSCPCFVGVVGRGAVSGVAVLSILPLPESKLAMKLAMAAVWVSANRGWRG